MESRIGIRKLPKDFIKNGIYEQYYFDTIEKAQSYVDEDWENENRDYGVAYLVSKPKDTFYYAILPKGFDWNVWNNLKR